MPSARSPIAWPGSRPLRASRTGTRLRRQSCVVLIERRIFEDQKQVALNPVCKLLHRHLNIDILAIGPDGCEGFPKRPLLLVRRQLGNQKRVAGADTVGKKRVGYGRNEIDQAQTLILCCVVAYVASRVEGIVMVPFSHLKTT
jgi:hypothetical protein